MSAKMFQCPKCGPVDHVLMDGYPVGERMLEGVKFEIRHGKKAGTYKARVNPDDADYFRQLNQKMWLREMEKYAADEDAATCPKCEGEVPMLGLKKAANRPVVEIKARSIGDVLKRLAKDDKEP